MLAAFLALACLAALAVTSALTLAAMRRVRVPIPVLAAAASPRPRDAAPDVSILKPIAGVVDGLEESLASFAALDGLSYELVLSIADPDDTARDVVDRVRERFPKAPLKLVIGGGLQRAGVNPKVDRLVAAASIARGRVLLVSDANVRSGADAIRGMLALLEDEGVGCVSSPFVGSGARSLGSLIESLHLLTFVVPGNAGAALAGVPCVVGKSMALRREVLDRIGGFEAFADVLAEDQAIGVAVTRAGYRAVLAEDVVENVTVARTVGQALARQVRWNQIRWVFGRARYVGEVLMNPLPLALGAWAASALGGGTTPVGALAALTALARIAQALVLNHATGRRLAPAACLMMPLKDLLQLATQAAPLWTREVRWHTTRARLGPGTRLLPAAA